MNFHAFYTNEMTSPAAAAEVEAIRQRQDDHAERVALRDAEHAAITTTTSMGLHRLATTLTPASKKKTSKKKSKKKAQQLSKSHEKRVKKELGDVMSRASDDMKGVIQGQSGLMLTAGFLTPLQEKLRAAQESKSNSNTRLEKMEASPPGSPIRQSWQLRSEHRLTSASTSYRQMFYPPRENINPWSQVYVDKYEVGGPTALQLATYENKQLERQLAKVMELISSLHIDTTTNMRILCGRCESHARWLTHCDRARMYVFDDTNDEISSQLGDDDENRRLVYYRSKGTPEYVHLGTLMTVTGNNKAAERAFLGIVPSKGNLQPRLQLALANVVTTGRSTAVPPAFYENKGDKKGDSPHRVPPATASWCFPIKDAENTNVLAFLVVVGAKNPMTVVPSSVKLNNSFNSNLLDSSVDTKYEDEKGQSEEFDEDKYSVYEASLFKDFLANAGIALRNCNKRNNEVNGLTGRSEQQKLDLQKQIDAAITKLNQEKQHFEMEKQQYHNKLKQKEDDFEMEKQQFHNKLKEKEDESIRERNTYRNKLEEEEELYKQKLMMEKQEYDMEKKKYQSQLEREEELFKEQLKKEENELKLQQEQFLKREQELKMENIKQNEEFRATLQLEEAKREVERLAEQERLQAEKEEMEREREKHQQEINELKLAHQKLQEAETRENEKLIAQKEQLEDIRLQLLKQQEKIKGELQHDMEAEKILEKKLRDQLAQLEAEVKHQKLRATNAKEHAEKSKKKLPLAIEQLKKMSFAATLKGEENSPEDAEELLRSIVDTTINILEAERATIFMISEDGTKLVATQLANYEDMERLNPATQKLRIVVDRNIGICGHVASTRQLFNIHDVYDDPRFDRSVDMRTGYRTKSMLVCPILSAKGEPLGVLQVMNKRISYENENGEKKEGGPSLTDEDISKPIFTEDDEQLIEMLSQHASMAIEHSRGIRSEHHNLQSAKQQLEQVQKELTRHNNESAMLLDAAHDIAVQLDYAQLDNAISHVRGESVIDITKLGDFLSPMFSKVIAHARRLCRADRASLFFCDYEKRRLWSAIAEGVTTQSSTSSSEKPKAFVIEVPMGKGVVGRVAETGKYLMTANARSLPFFDDSYDLKSGYKTMSLLCVPIKVNTKTVAVLMLINKLSGEHDQNELPELITNNHTSTPTRGSSRKTGSPIQEAGANAFFDEHDLDLAERLAAQVSGPVAHAQEMIAVAEKHLGAGKNQLKNMQSKMKELEEKANTSLKKTESELRNKVVDERTKASKMMHVLSFGTASIGQKKKSVGQLLSNVLDEVREVMQAASVTFHMKDSDRNILWPRSSSGKLVGAIGGAGTTSLATGGGGSKSNSAVAKTIAESSSAAGLETCRRACALSGEASGQSLGSSGMDVLCLPVNGRNEKGDLFILGVLEAVYPTDDDLVGAEKTENVFLQAVCTQVGAVLEEEVKAKTRALGEEKAANDFLALQEQIEKIKKEEEAKVQNVGTQLKREQRLSMAATALASNSKFRKGKHGVMADLFGRTVSAVTGLVSADRGSLFLVDSEKGMLKTTDMSGGSDGEVKFIEIPIKPNSIAGSCAIMGQLTNVPDAYKDARFNRAIDKKSGYRTKSMLTVPVHAVMDAGDNDHGKVDEPAQVIAVLQLINKQSGNGTERKVIPFDKNDVDLVTRFVIQISPSIRDALQQDSLAHEVAASHQHLRELETRLAKDQEEAANREEEFKKAKRDIEDQARKDVMKSEKIAEMLSKKISTLETSVKQLTLEKDRVIANKKSLDSKISILESQISKKDENYKRASVDHEKVIQQMQSRNEEQIEHIKNQHEDQISQIQRRNRADNESLNEQIKQQMRVNSTNSKDLSSEITRKEERILELTKRLQESEEREEEIRNTNRRLQEEVAISKANVAATEATNRHLQEELDIFKAKIASAEKTNNRLQEELLLSKSTSAIPSVSPGIRRNQILRVGNGISKLMEGDDDTSDATFEDWYENEDEGILTSTSKGEKKLRSKSSSATRVKSKQRVKKSSNSSGSSRGEKGSNKTSGVVLHFGPESLQNRKSASKTKLKRTKKKKIKKKRVGTARLSAEGGGPVTVVIDRSLFTGRSEHRSPPKRANRYFGSPRRPSPAREISPGRPLFGITSSNFSTPSDFIFQ